MTRKSMIGLMLGTIVLFVWNAISWMILPFHSDTLNTLPEEMVINQRESQELEDGVYHYPGLPLDNSPESWQAIEQKLATGPRIPLLVYRSGPSNLFSSKTFLWSLFLNFLTVGICLLLIIRFNMKSRASVLIFCLGIGALTALVSDFGQMNWYLFPLDYTLVQVFDRLVSFFFLGIVLSFYSDGR
ncbi:MAG: hypothetical protein AAF544_07000 [Bacteroidota bacterium]